MKEMERLSEAALSVKVVAKLGISRVFKIVLCSGTVQINFFSSQRLCECMYFLHVTIGFLCLFVCFCASCCGGFPQCEKITSNFFILEKCH